MKIKMKTRMKKLLAGMCAVLILPIGSAQTVLAEEPEQNFPISVEKAVNQTLQLLLIRRMVQESILFLDSIKVHGKRRNTLICMDALFLL